MEFENVGLQAIKHECSFGKFGTGMWGGSGKRVGEYKREGKSGGTAEGNEGYGGGQGRTSLGFGFLLKPRAY